MLVSTEAISLNYVKYSETSIIVKCFTKSDGLKSYLLKGIRTSKKKKINIGFFQPLTQLEIDANHRNNGGLEGIRSVKIINPYKTIHLDIIKNLMSVILLGLPTPANAILIVFLPQFIERFQLELFFENIVVLMILVLISSYLLISNHKMFSLKISNLKLSQNKAIYILFFSSVILLIYFGLASFTLIIILYIVLNLLRAIV